jgi:hypothetical protein
LVKNGDSDFKEGLHAIKTPTAQSRFIGAAQLAQGGVYAVDAAAGGIVIVAEGAALLGVTTGALAGMGTSASAVLAVTGPAALAGVGVGLPAVLLIDYISENNAAVALSSMEREESNLQEVGFLCDRTEADLLRQECEYYNPKNPRSTPYPGPTFSPSEFAEMRKRILEEEIPKCKETMRDALQRGDCSMESGGSEWQSMRCRSIRNVMCNVRPESALRRARLKKKLEALGLGDVNCGVPTYAPVTPSPVWNLPPL